MSLTGKATVMGAVLALCIAGSAHARKPQIIIGGLG